MPDSFAESADGTVLIANGIDPVVKWDGYSELAEEAGVPAPETAPTLFVQAGLGGPALGSYTAFVRFLDKDGNPSNLSPISNEAVVYQGDTITYTDVPVPQDPKVVRRQILRNTAGQMTTYYVDVDTDDIGSTFFVTTKTDSQLQTQEAVPLVDADGNLFANRYTRPPSTKPFLAFHLNRMWLAGEGVYAEGSVKVTLGSTTVTGIATRWPQTFVGRFLYVKGARKPYEIATVSDPTDDGTQVLTLTENYEDATDTFAEYAIKPPAAEANTMFFSEAGLPEAWPATNGFTLPQDDDQVTGLLNFGSFLYILKRRRMYRLTAQSDPANDGFIFYALGRGCVNHRCWAIVEEKVYLLDEAGVYRFAGADEGEQLSTPIQDFFRRENPDGINWTGSRYFHCNFDSQAETIRWFVSIHGEYLPRHALCLHYRTGKWWLEKYPVPVSASCVGRIGQKTGGWGDAGQVVYWGGPAGGIYVPDGPLDGVVSGGYTLHGTVTSAGLDTLTDLRATFDPSWENLPVLITDGRGRLQERVIVEVTNFNQTLRVNEAWSVATDSTSTYQVGGIKYRYTGQRMRYAPSENQEGRSVEVQFEPVTNPTKIDLRLYHEFSALPRAMGREIGPGVKAGVRTKPDGQEYVIDLTRPAGHYWQRFDGRRELGTDGPRLLRVQLEGVAGEEGVRLGEMVLNGVVK